MRLVFLEKVDARVGTQTTWNEKFEAFKEWLKGCMKR